jgi:hypothetical protein
MDFVRRLAEAARRRLAAALGVAGDVAERDVLRGVVAAAGSSEGSRRLLASLPREARDLLRFLLLEDSWRGRGRDPRHAFGWDRDRDAAAHAALFGSGAVARSPSGRLVAFPSLREGLRASLIGWICGADPDCPAAAPLKPRLGLLAAQVSADPPWLTQQLGINARWLDRVAERFDGFGADRAAVESLVVFLATTGALVLGESEDGRRALHASSSGLAALSAPAEDLALAWGATADWRGGASPRDVLAALVRAQGGDRDAVSFEAVVDAHEAISRARFGDGRLDAWAWDVAWSLRRLRDAGLVAAEPGPEGEWPRLSRVSPPPSRPEARWVVQPNFDVLVSQDVDPVAVARLGAIADLVRADHVSRFVLTKESVARAASCDGGARAALDLLAANAATALPENVEATVVAWANRAAPLRSFRGAFMTAGNDEQAAFLRARPDVLGEVAPGVFWLAPSSLTAAFRAAVKAGLAPVPVRVVPDESRSPARSPVRLAQEARADVERWARAQAPPKPSAGLSGAWRLRFEDGPDDVVLDELVEDVVGAVADDARLVEFVRRLDESALAWLAGAQSPRALRGRLESLLAEDSGVERASAPVAARPERLPGPAPAWTTPAPGVLRAEVERAIAARSPLDVLYVNADGRRAERSITPVRMGFLGGREWFEGSDRAKPGLCRFLVERVAAIRVPES